MLAIVATLMLYQAQYQPQVEYERTLTDWAANGPHCFMIHASTQDPAESNEKYFQRPPAVCNILAYDPNADTHLDDRYGTTTLIPV
jgi:hypothetical protein